MNGVTIEDHWHYLRIQFDNSWAWGYLDIPVPRWIVKYVRKNYKYLFREIVGD